MSTFCVRLTLVLTSKTGIFYPIMSRFSEPQENENKIQEINVAFQSFPIFSETELVLRLTYRVCVLFL